VTTGAPAGTPFQRARAALVEWLSRGLAHVPERLLDGLAGLVGELWYRVSPGRASLGRRNLQRVVGYLVANGLADRRVMAASKDSGALERLLRRTFGETVRYYADVARLPYQDPKAVHGRLALETPETIDRAFGADTPLILVAMHFGAIEYPAVFAVERTGRSILTPMETLADPALQAWMRRSRGAVGVEIVGLREARRALFKALADGQSVGLVADRHVAGGSVDVPFFGTSAPLPVGPALLAVETGRPMYVGAVRRLGGGRYGGRMYEVPAAAAGDRRERIHATTAAMAQVMERAIAMAPEQWWALLAPIWPDLDSRAIEGTGRLEPPEPGTLAPEDAA
jgi:phosphatidylinositol dimannoside acyltransferase